MPTEVAASRVHSELLVLGVKVTASTVGEILHDAGIDPAPARGLQTLRQRQAPQ
jgi:hypothetical protein